MTLTRSGLVRATAAFSVVALVLGLLCAEALGTVAARAEGAGISVEVVDDSPGPTRTPSPRQPSTPPRPPGAPSTRRDTPVVTATATTSTTVPNATASTSATETAPREGEDEQSISGLLYVGGLHGTHRAALSPFAGSLDVRFTIRNASTETVDATAAFWVTNLLGGQLGPKVIVAVQKLAPGETRPVTATIDGMGQWTLVTAHADFTPPATLGDRKLSALAREEIVFFVPWQLLLLVATSVVVVRFGPGLWSRPQTPPVAGPTPQAAS